MKKIVRLTERDLTRIVKRVIKEGVYTNGKLSDYTDGAYKLTKVEPTEQPMEGDFFLKNGSDIQIVMGSIFKNSDGLPSAYGSGSILR
jgi:hypothetical protein